jgi:hypothetical protein
MALIFPRLPALQKAAPIARLFIAPRCSPGHFLLLRGKNISS